MWTLAFCVFSHPFKLPSGASQSHNPDHHYLLLLLFFSLITMEDEEATTFNMGGLVDKWIGQ